MKRWALVLVVVCTALPVGGCASAPPEPPAETVADWATWTPGVPERTAWPLCDECAEARVKINLWTAPGGDRLAGSVPNRTRITLLDTQIEGGRRWHKVEAGRVTGWILAEFV